MALVAANFHSAIVGGPTVHHYVTDDDTATTVADDYFNAITGRLQQWDVMHLITDIAGTHEYQLYIVDSASGAASVTIQRVDIV